MKAAFDQPYSHVVYALTAPVFVTLCYVVCYFQQSHTTWSRKIPKHELISQQVYYRVDNKLDILSDVDQKVQMATEVCDRIAITPIHHFFCSSTSKLQTANQERRPQEISELNIGANLVATLCGVAPQINLIEQFFSKQSHKQC